MEPYEEAAEVTVLDYLRLLRRGKTQKRWSDELVAHIVRLAAVMEIVRTMDEIYNTYLNTNTTLYNAIVKAEREGALLSEESRKAANNLHADFKKGGIHLPKDKLERVNQLNLAIKHPGRKERDYRTDEGMVTVF
ncbi:hypothetical protein ZWY2020_001009 [Hordeum vulgare]|nr:hypothetical protein ZWY2020_001009 [Hordeum vulgare]